MSIFSKFKTKFAKYLYGALLVFGALTSLNAMVGPAPEREQYHYINIQSDGGLLNACGTLQQNLNTFLTQRLGPGRPNRLQTLGLWGTDGYGVYYENYPGLQLGRLGTARLTTIQRLPHITLFKIPARFGADQIARLLQDAFKRMQVPSSFRFQCITAVEGDKPNKAWIVARTTTMGADFRGLVQSIGTTLQGLGIRIPYQGFGIFSDPDAKFPFQPHISLAQLVAHRERVSIEPGKVTDLAVGLRRFVQVPQGEFPVREIILSPYSPPESPRDPIKLWSVPEPMPTPPRVPVTPPPPPRPVGPYQPAVLPTMLQGVRPVDRWIKPDNAPENELWIFDDLPVFAASDEKLFNYLDKSYNSIAAAYGAAVKSLPPAQRGQQYGIMKDVVRARLEAEGFVFLKLMLSDTEDKKIINNTTSPFWGLGNDGMGPNNLGKIYMELRYELRQRTMEAEARAEQRRRAAEEAARRAARAPAPRPVPVQRPTPPATAPVVPAPAPMPTPAPVPTPIPAVPAVPTPVPTPPRVPVTPPPPPRPVGPYQPAVLPTMLQGVRPVDRWIKPDNAPENELWIFDDLPVFAASAEGLFNYLGEQYNLIAGAYGAAVKTFPAAQRGQQYGIMKDVVRARLEAEGLVFLKLMLSDTEGKKIINNTTHPYWGLGLNGTGPNNLGKIYMELRGELRQRTMEAEARAEQRRRAEEEQRRLEERRREAEERRRAEEAARRAARAPTPMPAPPAVMPTAPVPAVPVPAPRASFTLTNKQAPADIIIDGQKQVLKTGKSIRLDRIPREVRITRKGCKETVLRPDPTKLNQQVTIIKFEAKQALLDVKAE